MYSFVVLIVIAVIAFVIGGSQPKSVKNLVSYDNQLAPAPLLTELVIPNNISNQIGIGVTQYAQTKMANNTLITHDGKPEILYIGAEYCPFCAAERWAMVIALMRFGSFSNLRLMTSSANVQEYSPSTPTFTFYNSTYTSNYISFVSVEETTNNYSTLQQPNASELALFSKYDPQGGIPFILFANKSIQVSSNYDPKSVLYGKNWSVIGSDLHNSSSVQAQAIIGSANLLTAEICETTNNTPSSVCSQQYVTQIEKNIRGSA